MRALIAVARAIAVGRTHQPHDILVDLLVKALEPNTMIPRSCHVLCLINQKFRLLAVKVETEKTAAI